MSTENPSAHPRILLVGTDASPLRQFAEALDGVGPSAAPGDARTEAAPQVLPPPDTAATLDEAREQLARALKQGRPYWLLVLDTCLLPATDPAALVQRFWQLDPNVQLVLFGEATAAQRDDLLRCLAPADPWVFVRSPFDPLEFRRHATMLLQRWSLARRGPASPLADAQLADAQLAYEALSRSQELLQSTFDAIPGLLMVVGDDRRIVMSNATRRPDHIPATGNSPLACHQYFLSTDEPCADCPIEQVFEHGEACRIEQLDPATQKTWEIAASPILDSTGNVTKVIEYVQEITDRKRNEEELAGYAAALESANRALEEFCEAAEEATRAKSEFVANMSHEIRTPMTAILGFADQLLDPGLADEERLTSVRTIKRNGEHLLEVLNDILDLSKIEAGKLSIEPVALSPIELVDEVCQSMRDRAAAKGLELAVDYLGPIPAAIRSDPTRLRQILFNLIGNAIKFTEQGQVRLAVGLDDVCSDDPKMAFEVADTGIGMTEEQIGRLFKPFAQADSSTARRFGGTGLGLAICKQLVDRLGGTIDVQSKPGGGSRFRVTVDAGTLEDVPTVVPGLSDSPSAGGAGQAATEAAPPRLHGRVLVAEDNPDTQRLIRIVLTSAGAKVELADDGMAARQKALDALHHQQPFDVILMDMQMPRMDGYEATGFLRGRGYTGSVVALTAHTMASDRQKCLDAGCDDYVAKPINRTLLIEVIKRQLTEHAERCVSCHPRRS
jgi:signal transduction histidine kinase/response regulator RpfG family c-di-GMP phosphodiesterase